MSIRKTTVNGLKWTSAATVGQSVLQLLQLAILTRVLPREDFGLVALTLMVVNFTTIFMDMGLNAAILHRPNPSIREYSSLYWLSLFVALLVYAFLLVASPLVAAFYHYEELNRLIPILGVNVLLIGIGRQHRTVLHKEFQFQKIALITFISIVCGLIVAVVLAFSGYGVYSLVFSTLTVSAISNGWLLLHNLRNHPLIIHFRLKEVKPFLKVGGYNMGSNFMDFIFRESDTLIIGKLFGAEVLGGYSLAKQLVLKIYNILNPVLMNVLNPVLSSIQQDKLQVSSLTLKAVSLIAAIALPVYLLVAVFSPFILTVLYGEEYASMWIVLSALAIMYAVQSVFSPSISLQIATGRTDYGFQWTVIQAITFPVVILFASSKGINGVAIALALVSLLLIMPHWRMLYRRIAGISMHDYFHALTYPLWVVVVKKERAELLANVKKMVFDKPGRSDL
jgi:O-antigen/teichoic acid export membrane protein